MKNLKKLVGLAISLTCFSFLSAQSMLDLSSSTYLGTAKAVEDDSYNFMNLISWNKINYDKFYGYTTFENSDSMGNIGVATHLKNGTALMFHWAGNLWADPESNSFTGFVGYKNLAFGLGYAKEETIGEYIGTDIVGKFHSFNVGAGMNVTENIDAFAKFNYKFAKQEESPLTIKFSYPVFTAGVQYNFKEKKDFESHAGAYYKGAYSKITGEAPKTATYEAKYNSTTIAPYYKLKIKPINNFYYGFKATVPVTFVKDSDTLTKENINDYYLVEFIFNNGFSADVTKNLVLTGGLQTELPYIKTPKGSDSLKGQFKNSFYFGGAFKVVPEFQIEAYTEIYPYDGISLDNIWNQVFQLTLSTRF